MTTILKGNIVSAPACGRLDVTEHGYLIAENGVITGVYPVLPEQYAGAAGGGLRGRSDRPVLCGPAPPRAPSIPCWAWAWTCPLLDWLNAYAFPTEARFADTDYARADVPPAWPGSWRPAAPPGCACSASLHTDATLILMEELEKAGITGYVGKVNMDRNAAPGVLEETTEESMAGDAAVAGGLPGFPAWSSPC